MSWKSVEMQVALPRTQDAGKIQEQFQQRGQHLQESLANNQLATENMKRKQVNDYKQRDNVNNKEKQERDTKGQNSKKGHENSSEQQESVDIEHPFLGKQIDFNG